MEGPKLTHGQTHGRKCPPSPAVSGLERTAANRAFGRVLPLQTRCLVPLSHPVAPPDPDRVRPHRGEYQGRTVRSEVRRFDLFSSHRMEPVRHAHAHLVLSGPRRIRPPTAPQTDALPAGNRTSAGVPADGRGL